MDAVNTVQLRPFIHHETNTKNFTRNFSGISRYQLPTATATATGRRNWPTRIIRCGFGAVGAETSVAFPCDRLSPCQPSNWRQVATLQQLTHSRLRPFPYPTTRSPTHWLRLSAYPTTRWLLLSAYSTTRSTTHWLLLSAYSTTRSGSAPLPTPPGGPTAPGH